jgi:hypothetical protein
MKPRDVGMLILWVWVGAYSVLTVTVVLTWIDQRGLLPWARHTVVSDARAMTRDDVVCDWPNRTINIKPGVYGGYLMDTLRLCGWTLEGTTTVDGGGSTLSYSVPLDHSTEPSEICWHHNSDPTMTCEVAK